MSLTVRRIGRVTAFSVVIAFTGGLANQTAAQDAKPATKAPATDASRTSNERKTPGPERARV